MTPPPLTHSLRRAVRAEWIKLSTLRSTYVALSLGVAFTLVFAIVSTRNAVQSIPVGDPARAEFDSVQTSFDGGTFAELAFGALGVFAITSEYATGMIRSTLLAAPLRRIVLAAKLCVLGFLTLTIGLATAFTAFLIGQRELAAGHLGTSLADPGTIRAVVVAGCYLAVVAVVGMGLGALIRHTAGALCAFFALTYLAYGAARAVQSWSYVPDRWLLVNAAASATSIRPIHSPELPTTSAALVELAVYCLTAVVVADWRFRRDP